MGQLLQTPEWLGDGLKFDTDNRLDFDVDTVFPIVDTLNIVKDPDDATKTMRIDVGAVAAAENRVLTMPNRDVDLSVAVVDDGSESTPSVRFNSDPDTGVFLKSAGVIAISVAGNEVFSISSSVTTLAGTIKVGSVTVVTGGILVARSFNDAGRPSAGTAGRVIFNTDDGQLNIDDGTNWTLPDGTTT